VRAAAHGTSTNLRAKDRHVVKISFSVDHIARRFR